MKNIQIVMDPSLLKELDKVVEDQEVSRSALIRTAVRDYLRKLLKEELEQRCLEGYRRIPPRKGEFAHQDPPWNFKDKW